MVEAIGVDAIVRCDNPYVALDDSPVIDEHVPGVIADFLYRRATTIYGGSAEIQRNIIASHLLPSAG
jgi:hypothetical protein